MRNSLTRFFVVTLLLSCCVASTEAQRRRGSSSAARSGQRPARRTPRAPARSSTAAELADARTRLADQVKVLSRFLYLYGRVSATIEATERGGGATEQSRAALVANFRNIRGGLEDLSTRFDAAPALSGQALRVGNASDLATRAEAQLVAGNLDEAGRTLVTALTNLTDALAALR